MTSVDCIIQQNYLADERGCEQAEAAWERGEVECIQCGEFVPKDASVLHEERSFTTGQLCPVHYCQSCAPKCKCGEVTFRDSGDCLMCEMHDCLDELEKALAKGDAVLIEAYTDALSAMNEELAVLNRAR